MAPGNAHPDAASTLDEFRRVVNMTSSELREWLHSPESYSVGMKHEGEEEAVGHQSGRRILEIMDSHGGALDAVDASSLSPDDVVHMRKVIGYVHRHMAQRHRLGDRSAEQLEHSHWASSLRNWGHDPMHDADVAVPAPGGQGDGSRGASGPGGRAE